MSFFGGVVLVYTTMRIVTILMSPHMRHNVGNIRTRDGRNVELARGTITYIAKRI